MEMYKSGCATLLRGIFSAESDLFMRKSRLRVKCFCERWMRGETLRDGDKNIYGGSYPGGVG